MVVWRLCRARHPAFDGEGARLHGGRWNPPGVAVVYASATLSLAVLEQMVRLDFEDSPDFVAIAATIPDSVRIERVRRPPSVWREFPYRAEVQHLGTEWAAAQGSAVLEVPSAMIPHESNYLLNPALPDFALIQIGTPEPFVVDPRMWRA